MQVMTFQEIKPSALYRRSACTKKNNNSMRTELRFTGKKCYSANVSAGMTSYTTLATVASDVKQMSSNNKQCLWRKLLSSPYANSSVNAI